MHVKQMDDIALIRDFTIDVAMLEAHYSIASWKLYPLENFI